MWDLCCSKRKALLSQGLIKSYGKVRNSNFLKYLAWLIHATPPLIN